MPITNRKLADSIVAPVIFDLRNDCTKVSWKVGDKELCGKELDMIVLRYETGVGSIPPIKTYDQLAKEFKRNQRPVPNLEETDVIREFLVQRQQVWAYIWFIPVFVPGSELEKKAKAGEVPSDCIWGTFIKSRSLDGTKTTGLWKHIDQVAGSKRDLIEVISCPRFTVTHQQSGSGTDCYGLQWSSRDANTDAEKELLVKAGEFVQQLIDRNQVDSVLHLPDIAREQFMVVEDDAIRGLSPSDVEELKRGILIGALGQSQFGSAIDVYQLAASPAPMLKSAAIEIDEVEEASTATVTQVAPEVTEVIDVQATTASPATSTRGRRTTAGVVGVGID